MRFFFAAARSNRELTVPTLTRERAHLDRGKCDGNLFEKNPRTRHAGRGAGKGNVTATVHDGSRALVSRVSVDLTGLDGDDRARNTAGRIRIRRLGKFGKGFGTGFKDEFRDTQR